MAFSIIMITSIAAVAVLAVREIYLFTRKQKSYSLRRFTLRMSTTVMLFFLLSSIFLAVRFFDLKEPDAYPHHWVAFWGCIFLLTGAIISMVIADFRLVVEETRTQHTEVFREIVETIANHQFQHDKKDE